MRTLLWIILGLAGVSCFGARSLAEEPDVIDRRAQFRARWRDSQETLQGLERKKWQVGGVTREALVYIPPAGKRSAKTPVIFAFHGHGGFPMHVARRLSFHTLWPEAICVYPAGLPTPVPVIDVEGKRTGWQKYIGDQADRDLAFFDTMLVSLKNEHAIDDDRIYSAGHSNGAYFTYVLCVARGGQLAAVAPIAGCLNLRDTPKQKPIPVLHVAGENDPIVRFASQERSISRIRELNGCAADGKPAGEFCTEYASPGGNPVVAFIHPGGHEIPSEAPARIVEFFKQHTK